MQPMSDALANIVEIILFWAGMPRTFDYPNSCRLVTRRLNPYPKQYCQDDNLSWMRSNWLHLSADKTTAVWDHTTFFLSLCVLMLIYPCRPTCNRLSLVALLPFVRSVVFVGHCRLLRCVACFNSTRLWQDDLDGHPSVPVKPLGCMSTMPGACQHITGFARPSEFSSNWQYSAASMAQLLAICLASASVHGVGYVPYRWLS